MGDVWHSQAPVGGGTLQRDRSTPNTNRRFILIAIIAGLGGFLFGYGTGVVAGVILFLHQAFALNNRMQGVFVAVALAGAAIGAASSGMLADRFGRRRILWVTAALFILGSILAALAASVVGLFLGRALLGVAIGLTSTVTPLYLAEITAPERRGAIVTINQFYITIGIFVAYVVDLLFSGVAEGWRWMLGLGAIPAMALLLGMWILPESPRWLMGQGFLDKAERALQYFRGSTSVSSELALIRQSQAASAHQVGGWSALLHKNVRKPMIVALGLAIFQQVTGINVVLYFAPKIFQAAGLSTATLAILATGGIGLVNVLATMIAMRYMDSLGRRKLLLTGLSGMLVSLLLLSGGFFLPHQADYAAYIIVSAAAIFVAFFAIGIGPVFWLLISEIFPLAIRGRAMSVATVINWASNMLVAGLFLDLLTALGRGLTFLLFAGMTALALLFTLWMVPETKGLSLEEIERQFISTQ